MEASFEPRIRLITYHTIAWVMYIVYELLFTSYFYDISTRLKDYIFFYACNISLFYWHFHILNRFLKRGRLRVLPLIFWILIEMAVILSVKLTWEYYAGKKYFQLKDLWTEMTQTVALDAYRNLHYLFISTVLWAAINLGRFRREKAEALLDIALEKKAHAELQYEFSRAQNAFLKQQINPHLLFNALNAIYSKVYQNSPEESKAVLLLSEIMRYSFDETDPQGHMPLAKELAQLTNLIDLNKHRFDERHRLDVQISGNPEPYSIIPLVLITLTENMFKHGDLRYPPHLLSINIDKHGQLTFLSENVPKTTGRVLSGIGLTNTRLRLDYAYPENYHLNIYENDNLFKVELTINLDAYERRDHR